MAEDTITYIEITRLGDDLLLPWLDLYETAFPPNQKVLVSNHLEILKAKESGTAIDKHLLAAVDGWGKLLGISRHHFNPEFKLAVLWYLAVIPEARNRGLGARFYQEIVRRVDPDRCQALILEVEIPEDCLTPETRQLAARRIEFYWRQGARRLAGIHYIQCAGWHQPPIPMHLLVHPMPVPEGSQHVLPPRVRHPMDGLSPQAAYDLIKSLVGDAITQVGELSWR